MILEQQKEIVHPDERAFSDLVQLTCNTRMFENGFESLMAFLRDFCQLFGAKDNPYLITELDHTQNFVQNYRDLKYMVCKFPEPCGDAYLMRCAIKGCKASIRLYHEKSTSKYFIWESVHSYHDHKRKTSLTAYYYKMGSLIDSKDQNRILSICKRNKMGYLTNSDLHLKFPSEGSLYNPSKYLKKEIKSWFTRKENSLRARKSQLSKEKASSSSSKPSTESEVGEGKVSKIKKS